MEPTYTKQQIKKIIQDEANEVMTGDNDYCTYERHNLWMHISERHCSEFEEEYQHDIYPSIVHHYPSKVLTAIYKEFPINRRNGRRGMYYTIVSAIMLEAEPLRIRNISHRDYPNLDENCQCTGCYDRRSDDVIPVPVIPVPPPNA